MSCGHADMEWKGRAACRDEDTSLFFPKKPGNKYEEALAICGRCPVQQECLDYALHHMGQSEQWGVWGGKTRNQRLHLKRSQSIPTTKKCNHCNKEFVAQNPRRRYCGEQCSQLYNQRMRQKELHTPGKVPYVSREFVAQ